MTPERKAKERLRYLAWQKTPAGKRSIANRMAKWRAANPERWELLQARRLCALAAGVGFSDIADEMSAAKAAQLRVMRAVKERK